eukprot:4301890-Prymnesium_polylepis.1
MESILVDFAPSIYREFPPYMGASSIIHQQFINDPSSMMKQLRTDYMGFADIRRFATDSRDAGSRKFATHSRIRHAFADWRKFAQVQDGFAQVRHGFAKVPRRVRTHSRRAYAS